ncbi:Uncharacterized protein DAT39_006396, partial [Clarias magur]
MAQPNDDDVNYEAEKGQIPTSNHTQKTGTLITLPIISILFECIRMALVGLLSKSVRTTTMPPSISHHQRAGVMLQT